MKKKMIWIVLVLFLLIVLIIYFIYAFCLQEKSKEHVHQYLDGYCEICGQEEEKRQIEEFTIDQEEITFSKDSMNAKIGYTGQAVRWYLAESYREWIELTVEEQAVLLTCKKPFSMAIELVAIQEDKQKCCFLYYQNEISDICIELTSSKGSLLSNDYKEFKIPFLTSDTFYDLHLKYSSNGFEKEKPVIQYELILLKEVQNFLESKGVFFQDKHLLSENRLDFSWTSIQQYFQINAEQSIFNDYELDMLFILNITMTLQDKVETSFYLFKDDYSRMQGLEGIKLNQNHIII